MINLIEKKNLRLDIDSQLFIRVLTEKDVSEKYVGWLNDYDITKYTEQRFLKHTFETTKKFVREKYKSKNDFLFGIFLNNLHIGNIKLGPIRWEHKSAEISFFIGDKNFWGTGITPKCILKIIEFAGDIGLKKICGGFYKPNKSSGNVFKKCGFQIEGEKSKQILFEEKRINFVLVGFNI